MKRHEHDQVKAAGRDSQTFLEAFAGIQGLVTDTDIEISDNRLMTIARFLVVSSATGQPRMCRHIDNAPTQPGFWFGALARKRIVCQRCRDILMSNTKRMLEAQSNGLCDVCLKPADGFWPTIFQMPWPHKGGVVAVVVHFDACDACNEKMTAVDR